MMERVRLASDDEPSSEQPARSSSGPKAAERLSGVKPSAQSTPSFLSSRKSWIESPSLESARGSIAPPNSRPHTTSHQSRKGKSLHVLLRVWLLLHQVALGVAALVRRCSRFHTRYCCCCSQGMHHATSPLALPWRVLAQLTLSNAAAIAAIVGAIPTIPAAIGPLPDIAMLSELGAAGLCALPLLVHAARPSGLRMALVRAPSPPIVAVISSFSLSSWRFCSRAWRRS